VSNNKLFFRAIGIIATFSGASEDVSRHALLRSIYKTDTVGLEVSVSAWVISTFKRKSAFFSHRFACITDRRGAHFSPHRRGSNRHRFGRACRSYCYCAGSTALAQLCGGRPGGSSWTYFFKSQVEESK
jgi:hypothetical protein